MARHHEPGVWMWTQACELLDEAERLHRQFFRPEAAARVRIVWLEHVDDAIAAALAGEPAGRARRRAAQAA